MPAPESAIVRWRKKFACAFAGLFWSIRTQNSFWVHIAVAIVIVALAAWLNIQPWQWVVLVIAITMVLAAELANTAIECLIKKLHPDHDPLIGKALDAAAASVLVTSIGAVIIGLIALGPALLALL